MKHPDPKAIIEQFMSLWQDFFDLATIQNGYAAASGGAS